MKLDGIIVPLITPLTADESLDECGLEKFVTHVIAGDASGDHVLVCKPFKSSARDHCPPKFSDLDGQ
ncbi:MAG: hypothetical protein FJ009_18280 [Chloroflexi bacterium]|nr:hypothetical protein [Chloroflexota bacterium]